MGARCLRPRQGRAPTVRPDEPPGPTCGDERSGGTRPADPPTSAPYAEVAIVAGVAASHVADHLIVPRQVPPRLLILAERRGRRRGRLGRRRHPRRAGSAAGAPPGRAPPRRDQRGGHRNRDRPRCRTPSDARQWFDDERVLDVGTGEALFRGLVEIPLGTAVYEEVVFRGVVFGLRVAPPSAPSGGAAHLGACSAFGMCSRRCATASTTRPLASNTRPRSPR